MPVTLANAPVSWGVDYPDHPDNPPWQKVMSEIREAGFRSTELGPYGFYPTDPDVLRRELAARDLVVSAGFIFQDFHDPDASTRIIEQAGRTIDLLVAIEARFLVVIDHMSEERIATAGRPAVAAPLDQLRFDQMIEMFDRVADLALSRGLTPLLHPHAGSYIEFEPEIEAVLAKFPDGRLGLCLDTGHAAYAGIDTLAFFRTHRRRIKHMHFKDIDPRVHGVALREGYSFTQAVAQGVFCPLARGSIDWAAMATLLSDCGYEGIGVVEQDVDPATAQDPRRDAVASLAYLRSVGF